VLTDPGAWLAFLTLAGLEIVLGIDNVILLTVLVGQLPLARQRAGRVIGLGLAMLTRIALLFSIIALTRLTRPWLRLGRIDFSGRDVILLAGGIFLVVKGSLEIRRALALVKSEAAPRATSNLWLVVVQIAVLDIVFSLDSVFTAVGLARPDQLPIMVAAIVAAIVVMMFVSASIGVYLERHPTLKMLALAFLVLVGGVLLAAGLHIEVPHAYLYVALGFAGIVEALNLELRRRLARRQGEPRDD
jgi:predicted tellurium resistance membrane protein TerC